MEKVLIHSSLILFSSYTIWSAQPGSSLFSWHPTCMVISQFLAMEAVLLFYTTPLKWRVTLHWVLQGAALLTLCIGFSIIYVNKELNEKPHFTSYHGLSGLGTLVYMIIQSLGGLCVKISPKTKFISPKQLRSLHRRSGIFALLAFLITVFLGTPHKLVYSLAVLLPSIFMFTNMLLNRQ